MQEMQEMQVQSLGRKDPLKEEMSTSSSILAWEIPWRKEPSGLQPMGSQRVGHDRATEHSLRNPSCQTQGAFVKVTYKWVLAIPLHRSNQHKWSICELWFLQYILEIFPSCYLRISSCRKLQKVNSWVLFLK